MGQDILYEGYNLGLTAGTGIATYARNLNAAARAAGYATDVLLNIPKQLRQSDAISNEVSFLDAASPYQAASWLRGAASYLIGSPFGLKAVELAEKQAVVEFAHTAVGGFDNKYASVNFADRAYDHFSRYRRKVKLRLPKPYSLFHATHPIPLTLSGCPNIYTIHDVIPLRLPFATLDNTRYFYEMLRHICKTADHIVTVSEHSRRDIMQLFDVSEDRITNTYQSVELPLQLAETDVGGVAHIISKNFQLEYEGYFLFVGAIEPKKNLSRLIDAYAASGTKKPFVIVGGTGWQNAKDLEKIRDERFLNYCFEDEMLVPKRQIRHLSYVPFEQLVTLIRGCRGLLFPSLYEGFGLPVLEAMQLGAPVMTSNVASLPEVAGDAAILVNPLDIENMSRAIKMLDDDGDLRQELRRRGKQQALKFSPKIYQGRIRDLYRRLLG